MQVLEDRRGELSVSSHFKCRLTPFLLNCSTEAMLKITPGTWYIRRSIVCYTRYRFALFILYVLIVVLLFCMYQVLFFVYFLIFCFC